MKRFILLLFFMAMLIVALGQSAIPNGNFESWSTGTYSHPSNYPYSSNSENAWLFLANSSTFSLVKSTGAYHGSYAAQLSTTRVGSDTIFGYFINTQPNSDNFSDWFGGLPYAEQPKGIRGYYKYNLESTDSATVMVIFSKKGRNIGSYVYTIGGVKNSYTPFNFTFNPPLIERGLSNNDVRAIAFDQQGNLWVGTNGGGVSKFNGKRWITFKTSNGLANDTINSIMIDELGSKWFGTPSGVSKYNDTIWTTYTVADGLANNVVYGIHKWNNKIWFGTNGGGVSQFDGTTWTTYTTANGLVNNTVRPIRRDNQGNIWFGTLGGISKFDGTNWTNYTTSNGLANNDVRHIQVDANNNLWFATNGGGVSKFNGTTWTTITTSDGLASNFVNKILIEPNGTKWFGTLGGGLSKFDGTNWTTINSTNGLAGDSVRAVGMSPSNVKFFGTSLGMSKFDGTTWTTISKTTTTTPDSMIFAAASSNVKNGKSGIPGATLFLDSVSLTGVTNQPTWLNGDFETWENVSTSMLNGWFTESENGEGVYKTTDKVAGDYAIELITYLGNRDNRPAARPGVIRTGYYPRDCNDNCQELGGYPYSNQKDTLVFYYKYIPSGDDSASVSINFKKNGNSFQQMGVNLHAASTFQRVEFPFNLSQVPDTVIIDIQSSCWQDTLLSFVGSRLIIDEIQFKSQPLPSNINIEENNKGGFIIYPNPASKSINVILNQNFRITPEYKIYSISGALVKSGWLNKNEISVDELSNGIYLFTLKLNNSTAKGKLVIIR